ncbi:hypothetical protein EMIT0324P_40312 [Pseudomonas chlororaphis]
MEGREGSGTDQVDARLWEQGVQGFQQAHVVDGFAEQVQHLQTQQVADVVHVGMTRGDDHRQVLAGGVIAQSPDQRQATLLRHAQVGDDQRDVGVLSEMGQGELDRGRGEAAKAFTFQQLGELEQRVLFIVHEKKLLAWKRRGAHGQYLESDLRTEGSDASIKP